MHLKDFQIAKNLNNRALAKIIKVDESWISHYYAKRRKPSIILAKQIERETGGLVTAAELLGLTENSGALII